MIIGGKYIGFFLMEGKIMANRKETLKKLMAVSSAMLVAGAMIMATPITAFADEFEDPNPAGTTIDRVSSGETLTDNNGTVTENRGTITNNNSDATVTENYGTITENKEGGTVDNNYRSGTVVTNNGYVDYNVGTVTTNGGTVRDNRNSIGTNNGTVENNSNGTIGINNGIVTDNYRTITTNNGRVINNYDNGEVENGTDPEHQWHYVAFVGTYDSYELFPVYEDSSNWQHTDFPGLGFRYLEQSDDEHNYTGVLTLTAAEGLRVTTGNGQAQLPTTCQCIVQQRGNNIVITVSSITGLTYLNMQQLNIIVEQIQQQAGGTSGGTVTFVVDNSVSVVSGGDDNESPQSAPDSSSADPIQGAITVVKASSTTPSLGAGTLSSAGSGRIADRAVNFKMSALSDAQYKQAVIENIGATPAGGLFRLETDRISCFDRAMLETFAKRSNVDMQVLFPLGKTKISVVIPAGYDINKLLDNNGYCGFLRLLALLGGEIITK